MTIRIASCAWKAPLDQLLTEVAEAGYDGVQLGLVPYLDNLDDLRAALDGHGLQLAASACGGTFLDPATRHEEIDRAVRVAGAVRELGGTALMMMCGARPVGGPTPEQIRAYAEGLQEVGRRCNDLGIGVGAHNHCIQFLETEAEIDALYQHLDPDRVGVAFDTGHLALAGMVAAAECRRYADRFVYGHIKDLYQVSKPAGDDDRVLDFDETLALAETADTFTWLVLDDVDGRRLVLGGGTLGHDYLRAHRGRIRGVRCRDVTEYQFAEIGHGGLVDMESILADLGSAGFDGWLAVELDVTYRTRLESARMSRQHLRDQLSV